ncbi:MAG: hypothetical protein HDR88_16310 [Bacteroides sp.]|nr:hypothetical protein [Bacteroides sp.]
MNSFFTILTAGLLAATSLTAMGYPTEPVKLSPPTDNEQIIEEQPQGDLTLYSRTCRAFREYYGIIEQVVEEGSIVKVVEQEDGTVWLHNTISMFYAPGWIKAEKTDDKLIINGPQLIYEEFDYDTGKLYKYFATAVEIVDFENEAGELMRSYRPTEDGVFTFDIKDNVLKESGDGSLIFGIVGYSESSGYYFTGYGDNYVVLSVPQENMVVVPDSAEIHDNWAMYYFDQEGYEVGKFVNLAIDGNDYYIQGIYPNIPDVWIKGKLEGNTVTFPNFQYLGPDMEWRYFAYLAGGQLDEDEWGNIEAVIDTDGFVMTLEDDGSLYADTNLLFVTSPDTNQENANFIGYFEGVIIKPQDSSTFTNPANPEEIYLGGLDGFPAIEFNLPTFDTNDNLLNTDNLYFSVFVNSQIFTFTPDAYFDLSYLGIDEATTELPFEIGNGYDFFQAGSWHTVYINGIPEDAIYNIGAQSIYYPEGKDVNPNNVLKSDIIMVGSPDDPSSVEEIGSSKEVKEVVFFDMQGRRVLNPEKGMYVKIVKYADGTEKTSKVSIR